MSGKIPISAACAIAKQYDCPVVIVFGLSADGEQFHVTTYGASKALCRHAASLGEQISNKILGGEIAPAGQEPTHLPDEPAQFHKGKRT